MQKGSTLAYTRGTQQLQRYTTITTVHNIHNSAQHIHDAVPECQVASTMISV